MGGGSDESSQVLSLIKLEALVRDPIDGKSLMPQSTPLCLVLEQIE